MSAERSVYTFYITSGGSEFYPFESFIFKEN